MKITAYHGTIGTFPAKDLEARRSPSDEWPFDFGIWVTTDRAEADYFTHTGRIITVTLDAAAIAYLEKTFDESEIAPLMESDPAAIGNAESASSIFVRDPIRAGIEIVSDKPPEEKTP